MKNRVKKSLSLLLAVIMMICAVPVIGDGASYNVTAAVNYANAHWNDGVGLCAEFVSRCLNAGGISIPNYSYYSSGTKSYANNSGTLGSYTNPYTCSASLLLYLSEKYKIITNPSNSDIDVGDVVFMYSMSNGQLKYRDGHVGICVKKDNGAPKYAAHNKAQAAGGFSSSYPCTYVAKINSSSTTDLGTDFYAYIINTNSWMHLTNDSNNVSVRTLTGEPNQVWYFSRQSDGSYSIQSAYDEKALEAYNFGSTPQTNVQTLTYSGNSSQHWYITGQSAEYIFRPKCSEKCVMDVFNNSSEEGANVQLYTLHGGDSQKFQIWKLDDYLMKPQVSTARTSYPFYTSVSVNWTKSLGADGYWLTVYRDGEKIFSENLGNVRTYTLDNLIGGEYTAYVEAFADADTWKTVTGNTSFTVENIPSPTITTNKNAYSENENITISWNKIQGATGYWLHIWKDGTSQYNASVGDTNQYTMTNAKAGSYKVSVEAYHEVSGWNNAISNDKVFTVSHTFNSGKITTAATCKAAGVKTYTCTACGATKTETIAKNPSNHTGGTAVKNAKTATCTAKGYTGDTYCLGCGFVTAKGKDIAVKAHTFNSGKVTTAATCKATGVKTYTCTACGATKTETIAKLGHTDKNNDGKCDTCGESLGTTPDTPEQPETPSGKCNHLCHKGGFIWRIVRFFWKLFRMNKYCSCSAAHY